MRTKVTILIITLILSCLYVAVYSQDDKQDVNLKNANNMLLGEDFGLGGDFRFGLTSNLNRSDGDFPMNAARRYFTSRYYGVNQDLTAYKQGDSLDYPEGDDFELDFYLNIKEKDPNIENDFSIMGFISLNFETSKTGTTSSSGVNSNRFYTRDLFVEIQDLFTNNLKLWFGDRKRAGNSLFLSSFRPSQDDVRLRGLGVEYLALEKYKISVDLGTHWFVKTTRPVSSQSSLGSEVIEEFVGYVPLDAFGNPLTSDFYTFIDDSYNERLRKIFTSRLRADIGIDGQTIDDSKIIVGAYGVFEYVAKTPGGKYSATSGSDYGTIRNPRSEEYPNELEFPQDLGLKFGVDANVGLSDTMTIRGGIGYAYGLSVNPIGPSIEYLNAIESDLNYPPAEQKYLGPDAKKLDNQRAFTFGLGADMWVMKDLNVMLDLASRLGSLGGNKDSMTALGADFLGNATPTLFMASTRITYFLMEKYQVGVEGSFEAIINNKDKIEEYKSATSERPAYYTADYEVQFKDQMAYMTRLFLLPGISLDRYNVVDGNLIYFPIGVTYFNEAAQIEEGLGTKASARLQWYVGVQSHIKF